MDILENDLEDIIENMFKDKSDLVYEIGCEPGIILRQPALSGYGKMDLINISYRGNNANGFLKDEELKRLWNIDIIELKRGKLCFNELSQLCRYMTGVKRYLIHNKRKYIKESFQIRGVLIGKEIEESGDFVYLLNRLGMTNIDIYTFSLDYKKGLSFNYVWDEWYNKNENIDNSGFDLSKKELVNHLKEVRKNGCI